MQTRPVRGVRPPAGVRQARGPARVEPALRAGRGPPVVRHVRGPVRVLAVLPVGRRLLRQRRGPAERHHSVHARFRVPLQGHAAVRLPVAVAHRLRALRTPDATARRRIRRRRRRPRLDDVQTDYGEPLFLPYALRDLSRLIFPVFYFI